MSWQETHRRWQIVREVEAAAALDPTGRLPWKDEYGEVFGDRRGLLTALHYRWRLAVEAQIDPELDERALDERSRDLVRRHAAILRILQRHEEAELVTAC